MNVILYTRVSTKTQEQDRQLSELTDYAKVNGYSIVAVISEQISGSLGESERKGLKQLLTLCRQQRIDKVLITEISRLGRKTSEVLKTLEILTDLNISVYSHNYRLETLNSDGTINPVSRILFTFLAEFARLEKELLRERIVSGLNEAKRKGKKLGRPMGSVQLKNDFLNKYRHVASKLEAGYSTREIALLTKVSPNTVQKVRKFITK